MEKVDTIYYGWWIVAASFVALFGGLCAGFYTISVFLEPLQKSFGWSKTQLSLGFMFSSLFSGLLSPITGSLVARYGVRRIQLTGGSLIVTAMLLISSMGTLWQYYLLLIIQAAGLSFIGIIPCQTAVSQWFNEKRGVAMGIIMAGVGSGGMTMIYLSNHAVECFGWRGAYRILAAIVFFFVLPTVFFIMRDRDESGDSIHAQPASDKTEPSLAISVGSYLTSLPFIQLCSLMLLFGSIIGAMTQHSIALLNTMHVDHSAEYWALALGVSVPGRIFFGRLADRINIKMLIVTSWLLIFISVGMLHAIPLFSMAIIFFALAYGLALGAFITLAPLFLARCFGQKVFSRLLGIIHLFLIFGIASGTLLMGRSFDVSGSYNFGLNVLLCLTITGSFIAIMLPSGHIDNV